MNSDATREPADDERSALLYFLGYQRSSVLSIVDDLDEASWHRSIVPSGWTIAGVVEHLGGAERHWFHYVVGGLPMEALPWDEGRPAYDPEMAFTCDRPSHEILDYYRGLCAISDEVLATTDFAAPLKRSHQQDAYTPSVRWVVLHMIEEIAAHTGHLEIARELLDGQRNRGLR